MKVLEAVQILFFMLRVFNAQFLDQPNSGTVLIPVQDQVVFICSVEESYLIDWRVVLANGDSIDAASPASLNALMQRNFILEGVATTASTLSLRETEAEGQTNNETSITCIAHEIGASTSSTEGNTARVIFYGAPPPPTDLNVTKNEVGSLNISWSLGFIEGVPVNYTLIILNLTMSSNQLITIAGLTDQHYELEASGSCEVYNFTVIAVTAAGNSTPSQEIIRETCSFTTAPNDEILLSTSGQNLLTTSGQNLLTTSGQNSTTPSSETQENLAPTLIIIGVIVISVLVAILVLVAVSKFLTCYRCHKQTKELAKANLDEPVYETCGKASSSDLNIPFAMSSSSAYGVTTNKKLSSDYNSDSPFAMRPSPAYEHRQQLPVSEAHFTVTSSPE